MRNFVIVVFLSVAVGLIQSSSDSENALKKANSILEKLDFALESKDYTEFLAMHSDKFQFKFCESEGENVDDLKKILETDQFMSKTVMSKHRVIIPTGYSGIKKVSSNTWTFAYEEHLLLENNEAYRTEGVITFIDLGTHFKIVSAEERCPEKVF